MVKIGFTCLKVHLKEKKLLIKYLKDKNNIFFYAIYSKRLKTYCGLASYLRIKPEHRINRSWLYNICTKSTKNNRGY